MTRDHKLSELVSESTDHVIDLALIQYQGHLHGPVKIRESLLQTKNQTQKSLQLRSAGLLRILVVQKS